MEVFSPVSSASVKELKSLILCFVCGFFSYALKLIKKKTKSLLSVLN